MSYTPHTRRGMGATLTYGARPGGPARPWRGGFGALGCANPPCQPIPGPLGDVVNPSTSQVKMLQTQLNRFAASPIPSLKITLPLAVNGVFDLPTASAAAVVLLKRATDANAGAPDAATAALLAAAGAALGNPVSVIGGSLQRVIDVVTLYADLNGLPAPSFAHRVAAQPPVVKVALAAGLGLVVYKLWKGSH